MDSILHDFRHCVRMLRRTPVFTIAVVSALALGIGVNVAVFSVINTVLLKPLPYPDPPRLMVFLNTSPQGSGPGASPTKFNVWRRQPVAHLLRTKTCPAADISSSSAKGSGRDASAATALSSARHSH